MQTPVIVALPSSVPLPWCPGQLPQSPTPRSTTALQSCPTMKNPRHAPDVYTATGWYHNDTEHFPDRYLFYT